MGALDPSLWDLALSGGTFLVLGVRASRWRVTVDRSRVRCTTALDLVQISVPVQAGGIADAIDRALRVRGWASVMLSGSRRISRWTDRDDDGDPQRAPLRIPIGRRAGWVS
ncbi:hypothetical protein [Promicromonospora sp. NPDC050262]|uniref:hypothetical protein n=1 Tax=Promicromonospora sp. NPDC050262 TaxID=3155036 RepID=UPI0033F44B2A